MHPILIDRAAAAFVAALHFTITGEPARLAQARARLRALAGLASDDPQFPELLIENVAARLSRLEMTPQRLRASLMRDGMRLAPEIQWIDLAQIEPRGEA